MSHIKELYEKFKKWIVNLSVWSALRKVQNLKFVQSTYIWLFVLPIFGKFITKANNLHADLIELPFAWVCLFFSALFFTAGNIIFLFKCPNIIKENKNFGQFENEGKTSKHLSDYMADDEKSKEKFNTEIESFGRRKDDGKYDARYQYIQKTFWALYKKQNKYFTESRKIVLFLYVTGIAAFSFVILQNICFVISNLLV